MGDVQELDLESGSPPRPPPRQQRPGRGRRGPTAWVAAAGVLVVAGALAAPPGGVMIGTSTGGVGLDVLDLDLRGAPTQVWRTPVDLTLEGQEVLRVIDDVVVTTGTTGLAGYDLADGDMLWEVEADRPVCLATADVPEVVCVGSQGGDDAEIFRVQPGTGAVARVPRPGTWVAVGAGAGALVVLEGGVDVGDASTSLADIGTVRLIRVDPDGSEPWQVDTQSTFHDQTEQLVVDMDIRDGVLTVPDVGLVVDMETGVAAADTRTSGSFWRDDRTFLQASEPSETTGSVTYDVHIDGQVVAEDQHVLMSPDDDLGGLVDLRLTGTMFTDTGVAAIRTDTGEELWRTGVELYPIARLGGVTVLIDISGTGGSRGVDTWTGDDLWTLPERTRTLTGSGSTLLTTDVEGTLQGLDVRTGEVRWTSLDGFYGTSVDIPTGMVVVSGQDLVRIDWPR